MPSARASRAACSGPAPPKASNMKSRRSWPRMVEIALMASSIFTSMMRTMPSAAAVKIVGGQIAEQEIAIGDRRRLAAAAVAGGARYGTGALRADFQRAEAV